MARRELISQLGASRLPNQNFHERLVVLCIRDQHLIDIARHGRLVCHGCVLEGDRRLPCEGVVVRAGGRLFVDVDVPRVDPLPNAG